MPYPAIFNVGGGWIGSAELWPISLGSRYAPTGEALREVWFWVGVIAAVAIALGLFAFWIRRKLFNPDEPSTGSMSFGLSQLREMRDAGDLSQEEYEAARMLMISRSKAAMIDDSSIADDGSDDEGQAEDNGRDDSEGHEDRIDPAGSGDPAGHDARSDHDDQADASDDNDDNEPPHPPGTEGESDKNAPPNPPR